MQDKIFIKSDNFAKQRDSQLLRLIEENKAKQIEEILTEGEIFRIINWELQNIIGTFNSKYRDTNKQIKCLKSMRKFGLTKAKVKKDILRLKFLGTKSSAYPINKALMGCKYDFMDFDKRQGECHSLCIKLAQGMKDDCTVLTGFTHGLSNKAKYLHSVIRVVINKVPRIIDTTMNAMVTEEFYKKLTNFEILTEIPSSQIKEDYEILTQRKSIQLKMYFLYRDEYIEGIKKKLEKEKKYPICKELEKPLTLAERKARQAERAKA